MKADCPERKTWMASRQRERPASVESSGRSAAASTSAATSTDPCLCTENQAARGKLPRMYVNVSAPEYGATGIAQARMKSVVDTGSTHTLISLDCLSSLGLSPRKHGALALVALDGKALASKVWQSYALIVLMAVSIYR